MKRRIYKKWLKNPLNKMGLPERPDMNAKELIEKAKATGFLSVRIDRVGIHVHNIPKNGTMGIYRRPVYMGRVKTYGYLKWHDKGRTIYMTERLYKHALKKLYDLIEGRIC